MFENRNNGWQVSTGKMAHQVKGPYQLSFNLHTYAMAPAPLPFQNK